MRTGIYKVASGNGNRASLPGVSDPVMCTVSGKAARSNALACLTPPFLHLFPGGVGQQVLELVDPLFLAAA